MLKRCFAAGLVAAFISAIAVPAYAGTTGNLKGRVTDSQSGAPLAGVRVEVNGAIGLHTTTTDASGSYVFLSLQPDTYTVTATKDGFDSQSQPGQSIFADQSSVLNFALAKSLKTIAVTRSNAGGLVRAGTTSDLYSVNPAQQRAAKALGGSGSLDQAYSAIASVPGVSIPTGQQGWYQSVFIRGGDYDQVGYEFDGLPVLRQSDGAPITTLSVLGQQEVQVYTGGTPATSDSPGLAGYINQVIKTGTYPGYANASLALGTPAFYHKALVEAGGASPDRLFSYYVGLAGADQTFRYGDQYNGVSNPLYFYPLQVPTLNSNYNILDGSCSVAGSTLTIAPGQTCATTNQGYGLQTSQGPAYVEADQQDRENVMNFHWGIKHHHDEGRDDLQALYVTGNIATQYTTSPYELGLACNQGGTTSYTCFNGDAQPFYLDASVAAGGGYYSGPLFQTPNQNDFIDAFFPSSPENRPFNSFLGNNQRDGGVNNYSIEKLQYQKNFNANSYLRAIAYYEYTNWFLNGPNSAFQLYGATLADYEVIGHIGGGSLIYSNNLSSQHLLTAQMSYQTQKLQTYNATFDTTLSTNPHWFFENTGQFGNVASNYTDARGHCYDFTSGAHTSCYDLNNIGNQAGLEPGDCVSGGSCPGSPASAAGAHWLMTENGQNAQVDNVQPFFTSFALTDNYRPNDRLTFNIGARFDHFSYALQDLESNYPARQFWFDAYNNEHCTAPGVDAVLGTMDPNTGVVTCPNGYTWMGLPGNGLVNTAGERVSQNVFQPRVAMTYLQNANTVWRASAGVYARPAATSYQEYNTYQQDLPSFLGQFIALGYNSPIHNVRADTSDNYDLSYERHFQGTQLSTKITPFYRSTNNQLQYLAISAIGGVLAGINVGTLHSYGVELSLQNGDFSRDGLSWQLSYTYTNTKTRYQSLSNGLNLIDVMNRSIEQYNSYTSACAANENQPTCGSGLYAANAGATLPSVTTPGLNVPNPYFNSKPQALMDPSAAYVPYDVIPSAFASGNSYAVPDVASLILNWRHKKLSITPTISWNSGSYYGSPLSVPGYVPQLCSALPASTPTTPGVSCGQVPASGVGSNLPSAIFVPDPYTGKFDSLGDLREPSQFVLNLQASYDFTPRISLVAIANNVFNKCYQRGYAWDTNMVCWYSSLPSNALAPNGPGTQPGAFLTNPPVQLANPYAVWFNNTQVGITSAIQPFTLTLQLDIKL